LKDLFLSAKSKGLKNTVGKKRYRQFRGSKIVHQTAKLKKGFFALLLILLQNLFFDISGEPFETIKLVW